MIPNYAKKYLHLWEYQGGRCAITGNSLEPADNIDMHHLLSDSKESRRAFPQFIHSVWNLRLVAHDAHMTKPLPERLPLMVVAKVEKHLQDNPKVAALINMKVPGGRNYVHETQRLLDQLLIEVWPERNHDGEQRQKETSE